MDAGWVVREVQRWEIRLGRIQICGEERVLQQEEEHLPRAGRQLKARDPWRGASLDWASPEQR